MKRFKYSLQTVHEMRERKRGNAELQVANAVTELSRTAMLLESVVTARERATDDLRRLHDSDEIQPLDAAAHSAYINSLILQERNLRGRVAEAEMHVAKKRQALTETSRDAEVTEKLRQRQRERHELEAARWEQQSLDEMAIATMARLNALNR